MCAEEEAGGSTRWSHKTFTMFPAMASPLTSFSFKVASESQINSGALSSGLRGEASSQDWRQPEYPLWQDRPEWPRAWGTTRQENRAPLLFPRAHVHSQLNFPELRTGHTGSGSFSSVPSYPFAGISSHQLLGTLGPQCYSVLKALDLVLSEQDVHLSTECKFQVRFSWLAHNLLHLQKIPDFRIFRWN